MPRDFHRRNFLTGILTVFSTLYAGLGIIGSPGGAEANVFGRQNRPWAYLIEILRDLNSSQSGNVEPLSDVLGARRLDVLRERNEVGGVAEFFSHFPDSSAVLQRIKAEFAAGMAEPIDGWMLTPSEMVLLHSFHVWEHRNDT